MKMLDPRTKKTSCLRSTQMWTKMILKTPSTASRCRTIIVSKNRQFQRSFSFVNKRVHSDALEIKSYPRDLPSLVRREDTTRKDARERKKERKAARLQEKKEEVKRLKALKMKEIRAKLEKIGHEGGKNLTDDPG